MNTHLSEIVSWAIEPLADAALPKSSEVISNEHLKSKLDNLNIRNQKWKPQEKLFEVKSMAEAAIEILDWCDCDESRRERHQLGHIY